MKFFDKARNSLDRSPYVFIAIFSILANLILIANPGFYSHDEWQRHDFLTTHSMLVYVKNVGPVRAGTSFGVPMRPIGFIQQGVTTRWMNSAPLLTHLFDAILHTIIALVFFRVLIIAGLRRSVSGLASVIFCLSPLAMLATGWSAASFDQWYCLFTLAGIGVAIRIMERGMTRWRLLALLACASAAMLSKETAMMLPAAIGGSMVAVCLLKNQKIAWRRVVTIGCVAAIPVGIYLAIRLPAVLSTMGHSYAGSYKPRWQNILPNAMAYVEYPFLVALNEIVSIIFVKQSIRYLALFIHAALIMVIALRVNIKAALAYLFCYFVFLIPVLSVTSSGSYYLYASSFGVSTALAWLILMPVTNHLHRLTAAFVSLCIGITVFHAFHIQSGIYRDGVCQNRFLTGLDAVMAQRDRHGEKIRRIEWEMGSPAYTGIGAIFGRDQYNGISFADAPQVGAPDADAIFMDKKCHIK